MCTNCLAGYMLPASGDVDAHVTRDEWDSIEWEPMTADMVSLGSLVEELYELEGCGVGGPLHIVTDDYNLEESMLDFCEADLLTHWSVERATRDRDRIVEVSTEIIRLMRGMTLRQRATAFAEMRGYLQVAA